MKRFTYLWFILCLIATLSSLAFYQYYFKQDHDPRSDKIAFCKNANRTSSNHNYHGPHLISHSSDNKDLVLCPGDTFGDLNDTYIEVKNCYLAMYYQDKMIWTSKIDKRGKVKINDDEYTCAFSLQRDGNLVLYQEGIIYANPGGKMFVINNRWDSQTNLYPLKTEVRLQNQQVQIFQTFKDGTERLFYADANNQEFRESMGKPIKVADEFLIKNHTDENRVFLERNEYIGDLNGTHLFLQEDCELQLLNKNTTVWSFTPTFRHEMNCFLGLGELSVVGIYKRDNSAKKFPSTGQDIMRFPGLLPVIQTRILFEDDQPIIIQTLKNGSELIFYSGPGHNNALKLKREPRQIAEKALNVPKNASEDSRMDRMDYIGNLTGLHLILEQNCSLMLANADQKLWEFQPKTYENPLMDCSLRFERSGYIVLDRKWSGFVGGGCSLLETDYSIHITGYQLTLKHNQLIITRQRTDRAPDLYHADSRTRGVLFQVIAEHSVIVNHDDGEDRTLPKKGYIGDLNGVYAFFEENCNWVLYNKTQVIWESGISLDDYFDECKLVLKRDGTMNISPGGYDENYQEKLPVWSSLNLHSDANLEKKVLKTELRVNDEGLWLINTLNDGTINRYKAMEGTHTFGLQREKEQFVIN